MRAQGADDAGSIVIGWLTKIAVIAAIVGLAGFDALSLLVTRIGVVDQGEFAARTASETWKNTKNVQTAYETALDTVTQANVGNDIDAKTFEIDEDGTVHLRVDREATTLVLHRIGRLREWTTISEPASGRAAP